jgi:hypothetical protein
MEFERRGMACGLSRLGDRVMFGRQRRDADTQSHDTHVLSHSTILILSGFLIGIGAGKAATPALENVVLLAGIGGLIAYIGLDSAARRRNQRATQAAVEKATQALEERYTRHLAANDLKVESTPRSGPARAVDQYVTVPTGYLKR